MPSYRERRETGEYEPERVDQPESAPADDDESDEQEPEDEPASALAIHAKRSTTQRRSQGRTTLAKR
jgi:hypothetical protein